jgi:hypothetical protein
MPLAEVSVDRRVVKHAGGVAARALSSPGHYVMYFDGDGPSGITLDLPAADYDAAWIDIWTGTTTPVARFHHTGGEKVMNTPEVKGGVALRVDRK